MSLLIKALEQAAKDRDSAKAAGAAASPGPDAAPPAAPAPAAEPTLEPPPPPRPIPSLDAGPRERSAATEPPAFARGTPTLDPTPSSTAGASSMDAPPPRTRPAPGTTPPRTAAPRAPAESWPLARKPAPVEPTLAPPPAAAAAPARPAAPAAATAPLAPAPDVPVRKPLTAPAPASAPGPDATAAARRTQQTAASLENIDTQQRDRARAATVMQASGGVAGNAITYLRGNPVAAIGALALLCGLGYGTYVYLQISNPGLFIRQAAKQPDQTPATPLPPPSPVAAPAANAPGANAPPGMAAAPMPGAPGPAQALPAMPEPSPAMAAAPTTASGAISASSVISPRAGEAPRIAEKPHAAPPAERIAEVSRERGSIATSAAPPKTAPVVSPTPARPAAIPVESQSRERIAVSPVAAQPRMNPALGEASSALQSGNLDTARTQYSRVLQSEPQNVDAMLGLAYVAAEENRTDDAMRFYTRILQLNPRHPQAQAAMIGLVGRADPVASETRLKQLIARDPSPFLHFVLGNIYADQALWPQAQQSYLQAHHLEPTNPDYAYNLAVGLDHIGQSKLALNYYRLAEQLASSSRANFSVTHARERIGALSSQLD